jgi:hypothetical protein
MRKHVSFANVVSVLALFIALGGGAYAATALPRNSVGARQLRTGAVTTAKVKDHSLRFRDFAPGQIPTTLAARPVAPARQAPRGPLGRRERRPRTEG